MSERLSRFIDRTQFLGFLCAIVLVPLVFNVQNQNIVLLKPILAQFIAFTLFALWIAESVERGTFRLVPTALDSPIVIYLLWIIATVFLNPKFLYFGLEELNRYLAVFLFFFLAQKTIRTHARLKWVLSILFAVCLVATGYGILQYLDVQLIDWGRDVLVSSFGNKNFFAGFLVITLPVVLGYGFATPKLPIRIILFGLTGIQAFALLLTETRTGFLALLVAIALFVVLGIRFVWWPRIEDKKTTLMVVAVGLLAFSVVIYALTPGDLFRRLSKAADLHQGTSRVRWIMWTGSSRAAIDRPITGHGHGSFQLTFPYYRPTMYHRFRVSHNTRHSHNEFLEILMETGTVGLSLFLLIFVVLGIVVFRFLKHNRSWFYQWLVIGLTAGVAGSLAQNFASVNLRWMSSTFLFWLVVSLIPATVRVASKAPSQFDELDRKTSGQSIRGSKQLLPPLSWKTGVHLGIGLVLIGSFYGFYKMIMGDFKLKSANALIRFADRRRASWTEAEEEALEAVRYNPFNLSARYKLGYVYLKQPNYRKALRAYNQLTDLAPNYAQIHNNIALIHRNFDRPYTSLLHFEWATILEDNFRNHMNLMRRHDDENLTNRSLEHGLSVNRIFYEDQRDVAHRNAIRLSQDKFHSTFETNVSDLSEMRSNQLNALRFLGRNFRDIDGNFSQYVRLMENLMAPEDPGTVQNIIGRFEDSEMIDPLNFLALSTQMRGQDHQEITRIKKEYLRMLTEWINERSETDPLYRLVIADLYAQIGETDTARKLLRGHPTEWGEDPYLSGIIERITG